MNDTPKEIVQEQSRRKAVRRALSSAFAGDDGAALREELERFCGEGDDLFAAGRDDRDLHYLLGRRSVWLAMRQWMKNDDYDNDTEEENG